MSIVCTYIRNYMHEDIALGMLDGIDGLEWVDGKKPSEHRIYDNFRAHEAPYVLCFDFFGEKKLSYNFVGEESIVSFDDFVETIKSEIAR